MNLQTIRKILPALEEALAALEAYERHLWAFECQAASEAIIALQTALEGVKVSTPESIVPYNYARAQAGEVRLLLAAYAPHVGSTAMKYLRMRQRLAENLHELIKSGVKRLLATGQDNQRSIYPVYIQLMPAMPSAPAYQRRVRSQRRQRAAEGRKRRRRQRPGGVTHAENG